jgi:hypothetical protein
MIHFVDGHIFVKVDLKGLCCSDPKTLKILLWYRLSGRIFGGIPKYFFQGRGFHQVQRVILISDFLILKLLILLLWFN